MITRVKIHGVSVFEYFSIMPDKLKYNKFGWLLSLKEKNLKYK